MVHIVLEKRTNRCPHQLVSLSSGELSMQVSFLHGNTTPPLVTSARPPPYLCFPLYLAGNC